MPIIKKGEKRVAKTWQQIIVDQIKEGKAIPVLSNSISNDLILGNHRQLILDYADYTTYPLADKDNLAHLTQFMSVMEAEVKGAMSSMVVKQDYLNFVKSQLYNLAKTGGMAKKGLLEEVLAEFDNLDFSALARRLDYPKFADKREEDPPLIHPLLILAGLDLPIYLTTGYHQMMEWALYQAGKRPRTGICRWNKQLEEDIPDVFAGSYESSAKEPLVYHLHGLDRYPASLVLTEDDHLEFLIAISQDADPIPVARVREALTRSSLLLLGYDLQSWEFRTLFWGLIKPRQRWKQGVSVLHLQLEPCEAEQQYLQTYLGKADFKVFWGSIHEYTRELYQALFASI
jgi:SIR2-like domain